MNKSKLNQNQPIFPKKKKKMHLIIPSWVGHFNEKSKKCPIYSICAHPTLDKLATGGQDCKIKIWNTLPIQDKQVELDDNIPKLLATLTLHNGAVLCLQWSGNGRLASGSDDTKIIIWEQGNRTPMSHLDGSVQYETYKPLKVLVGHESDVADLSWSKDDSLLASCGFDSKIILWDGHSFDKIKFLF